MPKLRDYNNDRVIRYYHKSLEENIYKKISTLKTVCYKSKEPMSWENKAKGKREDMSIGDKWGTWYDCGWFHFTCDIDEKYYNKPLAILVDVEGELLIYDSLGRPIRSLSTVGCREPKIEYLLSEEQKKTKKLDIWADAGSNDLFRKKDPYAYAYLKRAELVAVNKKAKRLYNNNRVIEDLLDILPKESAGYAKMKRAYLDCAHMVADKGIKAYDKVNELLERQLNLKNGDYPFKISAIGHGHLDLAWLWPRREAIRKAARTLSSAVYLSRKYPQYVFGVSQPQMLEWMKEKYPDIYKDVKNAIKDGRIEPQGAMWVESDTNIPGGEALIRQIHYGKKFLKEEFGIDMNYLWLPDVFGYTAALPQILKKSGVDYFFTQKISWNSINKFPHQSFVWEGLDESSVLAHFFPENTYNGSALPKAAKRIEQDYMDKDVSSTALMVYGDGDGGGGPGEAHLENLSRMENLLGIPPVKCESVADFINKWKLEADNFAKWKGELY